MSANLPPCASDPLAFDLDIVGRDSDAIQAALNTCAACPLLDWCSEQIVATGYKYNRTRGVIQAGHVLRDDPTPTAQHSRASHCQECGRKVHASSKPATPRSTRYGAHGLCKACWTRARRAHARQAALEVAS